MQGVKSGTIARFTAPGTRPTFFNDQADSTIKVLGGSVHIAGIDLEGAGTGFAGITDDCSCTPVLNTFIENVSINEFSYAGISFGDGAQVTIRNTSVSNIGGVGIAFYSNSDVTIANTMVTNVGGVGIAFGLDNPVTLSGVTVSGVFGDDGMQFLEGNTVTITNTVVNNGGQYGIVFGDDNEFSITRTHICQVCCAGIAFGIGNIGVITDTSITDASENGIMGEAITPSPSRA